jgi:hypothetical protein
MRLRSQGYPHNSPGHKSSPASIRGSRRSYSHRLIASSERNKCIALAPNNVRESWAIVVGATADADKAWVVTVMHELGVATSRATHGLSLVEHYFASPQTRSISLVLMVAAFSASSTKT